MLTTPPPEEPRSKVPPTPERFVAKQSDRARRLAVVARALGPLEAPIDPELPDETAPEIDRQPRRSTQKTGAFCESVQQGQGFPPHPETSERGMPSDGLHPRRPSVSLEVDSTVSEELETTRIPPYGALHRTRDRGEDLRFWTRVHESSIKNSEIASGSLPGKASENTALKSSPPRVERDLSARPVSSPCQH